MREVFEAKNLARVMEYKRARAEDSELDEELILLLHRMLIGGIDDAIAGRFRRGRGSTCGWVCTSRPHPSTWSA